MLIVCLQAPVRQATATYLSWQPYGVGQLAFWRNTDSAAAAASATGVADSATTMKLLQLQLQYLTFMRNSEAIAAFKAKPAEGPRVLLEV